MEIKNFPSKLKDFAVSSYKTTFTQEGRISWMEKIVEDGYQQGRVDDQGREDLLDEAHDPRIGIYLFDSTAGLAAIELSTPLIYAAAWNLSEGNPWVLAAMAVSPISANGIIRSAYTLGRMTEEVVREKSFQPVRNRALGLAIAPIKFVGTLSFPLQMGTTHAVTSQYLAALALEQSTHKLRRLPVVGDISANQLDKVGNWLIERSVRKSLKTEILHPWYERAEADGRLQYYFSMA
jgi:hypothetical protein